MDSDDQKKQFKVHLIPCSVNFDGKANVSQYFVETKKASDSVLTASFRGRPLLGQKIEISPGFRGYVTETKSSNNKDGNNVNYLHKIGSFKNFTYWNLDLEPSRNDPIVSAMDWLDISQAIHSG